MQMFGAFRQHQHLATFAISFLDFGDNFSRSTLVAGKMKEHILNTDALRQIERRVTVLGYHLQITRRIFGFTRRAANGAALHEDDRLLTIATDWSCGETKYIFCFHALEDGLERGGADMMTFINDHVPVVFNQRVNLTLA